MKRFLIITTSLFSFFLFGATVFGQTVIGGFNTGTQPGGANNFGASPLAPSTVAANATVGGLTRGAGVLTSGTGAARGMGGTGFNTTDAAASIAANKFFTFTVKSNTGYTLSLSSINPFDYRRSGTGPTNALVQYQIDGGAFVDISTVAFPITTTAGGSAGPIVLSGISALQNVPASSTVTFRIVPYGASAAAGTFYFFDVANSTAADLAVNGTVNLILITPSLSINNVSLAEGNSGTTNFTFTVTLSSPALLGGVTFDIATADGTATVGDNDYVANSLTAQTIPFGGQSYTFTVPVNGDTTIEANETFFVNVTNVTGANVIDGQGQGTIQNDDVAPPVVEFEFLSYYDDESQAIVVGVVRSGDLSGTSSVDYSTGAQNFGVALATGGAACGGSVDYITLNGTLQFPANEDFASFEIPTCSDLLTENQEAIPLTLANPVNASIGNGSANAYINDTANQFSNPNAINIGFGTEGNPYPSTITVSGAPNSIGSMRLTLFDFSHFSSERLDILLVGPQGQKFLLMADAGGIVGLNDAATITFSDIAGQVLPDNSVIATGNYEPTTWEAGQTDFPAPAPTAPYLEPGSTIGGAITFGSVFGGTNANGTWSLYIRDDNNSFQSLGLGGQIAGGWGLQFLPPSAASVSISGQVRAGKSAIAGAIITLTGGNLTEPRTTRTNSFGNYKFEGITAGETYVVTVAAKRYNFPQPSIVLNTEDNVTNADFEAEDR